MAAVKMEEGVFMEDVADVNLDLKERGANYHLTITASKVPPTKQTARAKVILIYVYILHENT
jgi:hypothetical protein